MDFDDLSDAEEETKSETSEKGSEAKAGSAAGSEGGRDQKCEMASITLWIPATQETMDLPVKTTDTILDTKNELADMYGVDGPTIRLGIALGGYVEYYEDTQITYTVKDPKKVCIKGIFEFQNKRVKYPNPFCVIGGGHNGIRQALEYVRRKIDFTLFERNPKFGGNGWYNIANKQSRLQSEGLSYQLGYDPFDGRCAAIWDNERYTGDPLNNWPSRERVLENYHYHVDKYKVPHMVNTDVYKMDIIPELPGRKFTTKSYDMHYRSTNGDGREGVYKVSCMACYPGAMCHTRRHEFPGEKVFEGTCSYGVSNEFPYEKVEDKHGIIVGMGAFFAENVRTLCEYKARKIYGICRHFNLMCPRVCSWTMSINYAPAQGAEILRMMEPMYGLVGLDPWSWWSVANKNAARTLAQIKQYTRWGVGDVYFLALYYKRLEMITSEIKTFTPKTVKLTTGEELEIQYCVKVLGFLSDYSMDKLMQCEKMLGPWPEGDWRRWVMSDQSEIDANRFGSLGLSCGSASWVRQSLWFHEHPLDSMRLLESDQLLENYAEPELGLTAYHYHPRKGTANQLLLGRFSPVLDSFHMENDCYRIELYRKITSPEKFIESLTADWNKYCKIFEDTGDTIDRPPYPYTVAMLDKVIEGGEEVEQYYLDYKCHRTYKKELLGYVAQCEGAIR